LFAKACVVALTFCCCDNLSWLRSYHSIYHSIHYQWAVWKRLRYLGQMCIYVIRLVQP